MIIYQLHEMGGDPEYGYDDIIGSYLRKERAEEEKIKAEARARKVFERGKRCMYCPLLDSFEDNLEFTLAEFGGYCSDFKQQKSCVPNRISCENYYVDFYCPSFYIEEVEVEE